MNILLALRGAALALLLFAPAASIAAPWTNAALKQEWAEALAALPADPRPKQLSANAHFAISDERRHDLFAAEIAGRGGALLGVGPEQNYLLAGWAKPEVLILMDFDQFVVELHRIYRLVFLHAETPAEFQAIWRGKSKTTLEGLIASAHPDDRAAQEILIKVARKSQKLAASKFRAIGKYAKKYGFSTFLADQDLYDGVRALYQQNRVAAVRGDLTATQTVQAIAKVLSDMKVPLRVLYLSNAEKYFPWVPSYRDNMGALPFDDKTLVIRTAGWAREHPAEDDPLYMYLVQTGANFRAWLASESPDWSPMLRRRGPKIAKGFWRIEAEPPSGRGR